MIENKHEPNTPICISIRGDEMKLLSIYSHLRYGMVKTIINFDEFSIVLR